jgi:Bacterial regulatory proteins, tetR family
VNVKAVERRIQRTQHSLRSALMELIQEKGFESLSVQDIIDRANVARATFYAHFDNTCPSPVEGLNRTLRHWLTGAQCRAMLPHRAGPPSAV